MRDALLLKNQLIFSAKHQGTKKDSVTGEEAGKIFHEFPEFIINNLSTKFNACDTTALFLIAHYYYKEFTGDLELLKIQKQNILNSVEYIKSHLVDNVFFENPRLADTNRFALKVTYWKDSEIIKRENGMPVYPISYFLAHVINLCGIRSAAKLLESEELLNIAKEMKNNLRKFFNAEKKLFYIALDSEGPIEGINSDLLHSLFYLEKDDLNGEELKFICEYSCELETSIGYLTLSPKLVKEVTDSYHSTTVWPFEQAIINIGAKKFNLSRIEEVSRRIINYLDTEPEIFCILDGKIEKGGCDPQLWTIAAKKYFLSNHAEFKEIFCQPPPKKD
jgi:glycogen debranching enzyme